MKFSTILATMTLIFSSITYSIGSKSTEPQKFKSSTFKVEVVVDGLEIPWGFDFLPGGDLLFSERSGAIKVYHSKTKKVVLIKGVPKVKASNQGGMLDILVHPQFKKNKTFFLSYSKVVKEGLYTTAVAKAVLDLKSRFISWR